MKRMIMLQDLCKKITDGVHNTPKLVNQGIPMLDAVNISDMFIDDTNPKKFITQETDNLLSRRCKPTVGDILLSSRGTIGKVAIVQEGQNFNIMGNIILIRVDGEKINYRFLAYYLLTINKHLNKLAVGANQKGLYLNDVRALSIPELSYKEQLKIVELLDKSKTVLEMRKQSIKLLDELIQSVFYDMFGDPVENGKGLEVKKLKDLSSKILSGNTPKGGSQVYVENGVLFLRSQNVWRNRLDLDDVAYIDEETHKKMKNSSLEYKDLLMTKTGRINTENSSLGRAAIYLGESNRANINGHVYLIRLKKEANHEFVLFILTTKEYREYIRSVCVGGIDKRQINKVHLEEFPIISPPINLQNEFAALVTKISEKRDYFVQSEQKIEYLFKTLLQQSFNVDQQYAN